MNRILLIALFFLTIQTTIGDCESFKYEPHGRRDPFVPLIGQDKIQAAVLSDISSVEDIKLEGIATSADGRRTAIMNGEIVKEGERIGEVEIKKIGHKSVIFLLNGKESKVSLPEEGGLKSE